VPGRVRCKRWLGAGWPPYGIRSIVNHRQNDHSSRFDCVENRIRKIPGENTPNGPLHHRPPFRILGDIIEGLEQALACGRTTSSRRLNQFRRFPSEPRTKAGSIQD
jgi:hypothetical protein